MAQKEELGLLKSLSRIRELIKSSCGGSAIVLGGGITGSSAALLLSSAGITPYVLDEGKLSTEMLEKMTDCGAKVFQKFDISQPLSVELRNTKADFAISSPGIDPNGALYHYISKVMNIEVLSEIDVAISYLGQPAIAVTGTNGKTTTVNLIDRMIGHRSKLLGNVGTPMLSEIPVKNILLGEEVISENFLVVELSSYQLQTCKYLKPKVGIWLNTTEDHLERHKTLEEYHATKCKLFALQDELDWSLINRDDEHFSKTAELANGEIVQFGIGSASDLDSSLSVFHAGDSTKISYGSVEAEDGLLTVCLWGEKSQYFTSECPLIGRHNLVNLASASISAQILGVPTEIIQQTINSFEGLEHRMEKVDVNADSLVINDSKSTNISSLVAAVQNSFRLLW